MQSYRYTNSRAKPKTLVLNNNILKRVSHFNFLLSSGKWLQEALFGGVCLLRQQYILELFNTKLCYKSS
jgi:hypothetical protein